MPRVSEPPEQAPGDDAAPVPSRDIPATEGHSFPDAARGAPRLDHRDPRNIPRPAASRPETIVRLTYPRAGPVASELIPSHTSSANVE